MSLFPAALSDTNTDYLADAQAFRECSVECEWPVSSNIFIKRTAKNSKPGMQLNRIDVGSFMGYCGLLVASFPDTTFTFAIDLSSLASERTITAHLISTEQASTPPVTADNVGFFPYAVTWFSTARTAVTVSVASGGLFWAHRS